ncbi:hypothetical protein Pst134EA_033377 [Puccinia striiformis f. sp. tritici]|uniref:hypothetical protein n=1 Tax=Puccinia striiformis f. sp. tritici TaxID=168172 RepID=UPI00200842D6|nr:hypothetical protein Pst134EA_033377 [Puccinia striiformis f. sp. tritici]KAH9468971.1 hypothetical protein Pst134EA_033377 [Puccinia striiformis f. sp. tritici]
MPRTRKRTQSTISSSQPPTQQDADTPQQDADTEEAEDHDKSGEDNIPPTDEEELERAIRNAANGQSAAYQTYGTPELSHKKDKYGRLMIAYPCKMCGDKINRPTKDSSCSNLLKHATGCMLKQSKSQGSKSLTSVGITGTGDIDPKEVPQLCAIWCAEAARPFSALVDPSHKALLHPTIAKHLPTRKAVLKDIHRLYSAIQENYRSVLKEHKGALYLGVDGWQSPNGFDILGVVIYRLTEDQSGGTVYEAMPLDFLRLTQSHTGEYIAQKVQLVVEKFGIADKICGIVTNNATNNEVMVRELKRLKWRRFKGETQWIRCFAHILNLIAQAILRPFGAQKNKRDTKTRARGDADSDDDVSEEDHAEGQIRLLEPGDEADAIGSQDEFSSDIESVLIPTNDGNDSLDEEDIDGESEEDENDCYTSDSCKETLAKFRAIAKKLRYSPNSKAEFVDICQEKKCAKPHTVERDVRTRWNSTAAQLKSVVRCEAAILIWQRHKKFGIARQYYVDESDFALARDLIVVLNLFYEITLQVSTGGSTRIASVVVFIDQITEHLSTIIREPKYPPALRNACRIGLKLTNKYYSLTDSSPLYRIAILLHPSFKDEYFKLAAWEPEWIAEAIRLAQDMWVTHYKPRPVSTPRPTNSPPPKERPISSMLAALSNAAATRGGSNSTDPFDLWLAGGLVLDRNQPVNPLKWWIQQKRAGNTHGGLIHMALDVLSCPATSVDVERAFSFGRDYVSSKRHRLAPQSLSRGMTVAFFSKNNKIKPGLLARWKKGVKDDQEMKQKGKGKRKIIVLDED